MKNLKFYEVDKEYIDYLKQNEPKIPNISYDTHNKFVCGVVLEIDGFNYFAPISSFNKKQRTNLLIKNSKEKVVASIRFSFMFPAPMDVLKIKDFKVEDYHYQRLLNEEYIYCNKNKERIISKAQSIYFVVTAGKNEIMNKVCCDFKKLEEMCKLYKK